MAFLIFLSQHFCIASTFYSFAIPNLHEHNISLVRPKTNTLCWIAVSRVIVWRYIEQIIANNVPLFFFYVPRQFIEASICLTSKNVLCQGFVKECLQTLTTKSKYLNILHWWHQNAMVQQMVGNRVMIKSFTFWQHFRM